jgi:pyruvate dehydrogenase E2 component (dihydrolipoamide acetyltransferase)
MRKAIAAAMARSKREIPHYYVAEDIPLARALAWLQGENAKRPMAERLLPAALLLKAVAIALKRYPELNGYFRDGAFVPGARINLGVAISLRQGGLIAPALLDAGAKPLTQLMQELTDLVQRSRAGSLRSSELADATITVTNLGDQGAQAVFGVIYPPQVALVGFGRVTERPWADEAGGLKLAPVVTASLAADHRVSDGHRGALFLRELADLLQHPEDLGT